MSKNDLFMNLVPIYDLSPDDGYGDCIEKIFQFINNRYPNLIDATLIDIGGGNGRLTYQIFDHVNKIILIEPSEEMFIKKTTSYFLSSFNTISAKFFPII
jgi:ubiquinone/menaquinone biosynthesis C-methylase UbiE